MYKTAFGQDGPTPEKLAVFVGVIGLAALLSTAWAMWRRRMEKAAAAKA
jgi:hypothetical protein